MLGDVDPSGLRVNSAWPAWLSPIGWGQQMRPFGGDHWWPLGLSRSPCSSPAPARRPLLAARRDLGQGMLPERRGRARAGRALLSPLGLAWRLQRGALLGWAVGMLGFGLVLGGLIGQVQGHHGRRARLVRPDGRQRPDCSTPTAPRSSDGRHGRGNLRRPGAAAHARRGGRRVAGADPRDRGQPASMGDQPRAQRMAGRDRACSCCSPPAWGWPPAAVLGDPAGQLRELIVAGLVQLPGILVIGGVVIAVVGAAAPLAGAISWTVLIVSHPARPAVRRPTLQVPSGRRTLAVHPRPEGPGGPVTAVPVVALIGSLAGLAAAGLVSLRRRDLALPA